MASLFEEQNQPLLLRCLVAQRMKYAKAKRIRRWELFLVANGVVLNLYASYTEFERFQAFCCLFAVVFVLLVRYLDRWANNLRFHAASIQQYFDYSLFNSRISATRDQWAPLPIDSEILEQVASVSEQQIIDEKVNDWYSDYSDKEPDCQVFLSQRENTRWSIRQTRRFFIFCIIMGICATLALLGFGLYFDPRFMSVICLLCWFFPLIDFFATVYCRLWRTIVNMKAIIMTGNSLEEKWCSLSPAIRASRILEIQKALFQIRSSGASVPDWFYNIFRNSDQAYEDKVATLYKGLDKRKGRAI